MVISEPYFPLLDGLPYSLTPKDVPSAEIATHGAAGAWAAGAAWKQARGRNTQRLLQLWKSPSKSAQRKLPSEHLLVGRFRGKYFCLAFFGFFSLRRCVLVQRFICLPQGILDFIYSSCSFPTWYHTSTTVASQLDAIGTVTKSCSNVKTSAGENAEAAGLILNKNELIFVDLPLVLIKSRKLWDIVAEQSQNRTFLKFPSSVSCSLISNQGDIEESC